MFHTRSMGRAIWSGVAATIVCGTVGVAVWTGCGGTVSQRESNEAGPPEASPNPSCPGSTSAPVQLASTANPDANVVWVGIAGGVLYYAVFGVGIASVPVSGGATPTMVSAATTTGGELGSYVTNGVAFDSAYVYWSESGAYSMNAIKRAPLAGGSTQTVATSDGFTAGLAVDSGSVYWVDQVGGQILAAPVDGGAVITIATGLTMPAGIAVQGGTIYATDTDSDLVSVPVGGGTVTTLVHGPGLPPNVSPAEFSPVIAADKDNVYFPQYYAPQHPNLSKVARQGGAPTVLATGHAYSLAVDSTSVYWLSYDDHALHVVPVAGGADRVVAMGVTPSAGPALDDCNLYWGTSEGTVTCVGCPLPGNPGVNAVWKLAK